MVDSNIMQLKSPATDVLGEVFREGAQQLIAKTIEAEITEAVDVTDCLLPPSSLPTQLFPMMFSIRSH